MREGEPQLDAGRPRKGQMCSRCGRQEPVAVKEGFAEWLDPWGGEYIRRGRS